MFDAATTGGGDGQVSSESTESGRKRSGEDGGQDERQHDDEQDRPGCRVASRLGRRLCHSG